uniref:Uncharacterized protein n=1 Tax=Arundo donax TaxID=35708 RepID=A0A0A9A6M4_ARUDO
MILCKLTYVSCMKLLIYFALMYLKQAASSKSILSTSRHQVISTGFM